MLATILLAILITGFAVGGLAIGVVSGREPLRGSCGGLSCHACPGCKHR